MKTLAVPTPIRRTKSSAKIVSTTTGDFKAVARLTRAKKFLAEVMGYQNPDVVARLAKEEKLSPEEAESLFKDTLLFLWLGSQVKGSLAPTPRIDLGWHVFLLFTQDYREFCQEYFGRFVDHHPRRLTDKPDNGKVVEKSHGDAQTVLVEELDLSLSKNWIYDRLEQAVKDCCGENCASAQAEKGPKCCGNCGSDCCSR